MSSGTYKLSSSYSNVITSGKIHYLSAYDPAFYNVMVMGDEVWVEPKYISSMFGDWGSSSRLNVNINLNYGWGGYYPWRYWGSPYDSWYTWGWNPYWGWDYYWGWNHYYWWPGYWSSGYWGTRILGWPRRRSLLASPHLSLRQRQLRQTGGVATIGPSAEATIDPVEETPMADLPIRAMGIVGEIPSQHPRIAGPDPRATRASPAVRDLLTAEALPLPVQIWKHQLR